MNVQTIVTAILSSSLVGLVVGYLLNRRLETARLRLEETIRRDGEIRDIQTAVYLDLLETTYRIRNAARDFSSERTPEDLALDAKSVQRFEQFQDGLVELLYKKRGVMPPVLFQMAHELKTLTAMLAMTLNERTNRRPRGHVHGLEAQGVTDIFRRIDAIYSTMVPIVHAHVGVRQDDA